MTKVLIERVGLETTAERSFEIVERKGIGHPDTICDSIMEAAGRALARTYLEVVGAPQHFNLDKGLLAAGRATPQFGGGRVEAPMRLIFGDRAVYEAGGRAIDVEQIVVESARSWFRGHLRFVDPDRHVVFQNEVRQGSPQLTGLFQAAKPPANDTSAAVGWAPLTPTERVVLATERFLNGAPLKARFPEAGEDVKVMAVRRRSSLSLTIATAFVDRFIDSEASYFRRKEELRGAVLEFLSREATSFENIDVDINALDSRGGSADSIYLTVTGTSAEGGDSGQVGRGNRLSGLFSARRPGSNEAIAGKNPQSHVGKIYNVVAQKIAERVVEIEGVREAAVHLVSRIGQSVESPQMAAVELVLERDREVSELAARIESATEAELGGVSRFADDWIAGKYGND